MKRLFCGAIAALALSAVAQGAETPTAFVKGLAMPESVCYGPKGLLYVTEIGEFGKDGDGKVTVIENGEAKPFATGLDDPKGIVFFKDALYLTDKTKVIKVDANGKTSVYAAPEAFPKTPIFLNDIAVDVPNGIFLVSDSGDNKGKGGAIYRIDDRLHKIELVADTDTIPELNKPNGVAFDGASHAIFADMNQGALYRVRMHDKKAEKIAEGMDGADGLVWDNFGRFFVTSWTTGKTFAIPRPGVKPILIGEGLQAAADACLSKDGNELIIPDMKAGTITKLSTQIPGWEVNDTPLAVEFKPAFDKVEWTGWDATESGKVEPLRPIVLTHANDGSNRVFVATQHGVIHAIENHDKAQKSKVLLDMSEKVRYNDRQNEEGFLGLAFHPQFKENGEFFVFYTDVNAKLTNVVSRFRVKKDNPGAVDPASEEVLLRIDRPFWNHDGGTLAFGPDGYLYIALGDGGAGGDPHENGQNLKTLLGKVLRIDVNTKSANKPYGIPADNPFAKDANALPEIYAYGLRNIWRFAFDRKTGQLWAGEVGQNLFEEICLINAGGNYGWSIRESLHPFGNKGVGEREDLIDPIWEYHHDLGKSITGGTVYRGKEVPEAEGAYIYADYVTTRMWALKYDADKKRVVANQPIKNSLTILSFGEDQDGEVYALTASPTGKGIYKLSKGSK